MFDKPPDVEQCPIYYVLTHCIKKHLHFGPERLYHFERSLKIQNSLLCVSVNKTIYFVDQVFPRDFSTSHDNLSRTLVAEV